MRAIRTDGIASPAGTTGENKGRRTRPPASTQRCRRRQTRIRAGCAPTAPSPAGTPGLRRPGGSAQRPVHRYHRRLGPLVRGTGTDGTITCWGALDDGQTDTPAPAVQRRRRWLVPFGGDAAPTAPLDLLGRQLDRAGRLRRPAGSPPLPPADSIHAVSAPTAPLSAGATTGEGRPTRPTANTPPSPPARTIRAGCAPTAPSPAGARTTTGRPTRPAASTPPSPPARGIRAGCAPTAPSPAGDPSRCAFRHRKPGGRPHRPADIAPQEIQTGFSPLRAAGRTGRSTHRNIDNLALSTGAGGGDGCQGLGDALKGDRRADEWA